MKLIKQLELITVIYISSVFYPTFDSVVGRVHHKSAGKNSAEKIDRYVGSLHNGEKYGKPKELYTLSESERVSKYYEKYVFVTYRHFLSAVQKYHNPISNKTAEKKEVEETFKMLLSVYGKYSEKFKNAVPQNVRTILESAVMMEKLVNTNKCKLPNKLVPEMAGESDNVDSIINNYRRKRLLYSNSEFEYLRLLLNYYNEQVADLSIEKDVKITKRLSDEYQKLKAIHSDYSQLHESLLKKNISTESIRIYTIQRLLEEPVLYVLRRHGYANKDHGITEKQKNDNYIIKQHNQARSQYYSARKDYSLAVFKFLYKISVTSYLNVIFQYKQLIDVGNLYHEVYLYMYNNNLTFYDKYPFPEIPDVIIDTSTHWWVYNPKLTEQRPEFRITEGNITYDDIIIRYLNLKMPLIMYEKFFKSFKDDPKNELAYYLTISYFNDFLLKYSVFDYLYRYWFANANASGKNLVLSSKFSNITYVNSLIKEHENLRPESKIISQLLEWNNLEKYAKSLINDQPDVSSWKIKTLTSGYLINIVWNLAISDLFLIRPIDEKALDYRSMPLNIVDLENNKKLANYQMLCMFLKSESDKGDNKTGNTIQCPITETYIALVL